MLHVWMLEVLCLRLRQFVDLYDRAGVRFEWAHEHLADLESILSAKPYGPSDFVSPPDYQLGLVLSELALAFEALSHE